MTTRIAIQMDPLEDVIIDHDTTFMLTEEAQARGHEIFVYEPKHLILKDGRPLARVRPATVQRVEGTPALFGEERVIDLGRDTDVILIRQDPPFDMSYITACHLLELVTDETLILNDPAYIRGSPEKLFPLMYPEIMPPTLITRDVAAIKDFREEHKDIIVKPLFGMGGAGVFRLKPGDSNLASLLEMFFAASREPIIVQGFLPAVSEGDKRIILIEGEAVGAINRRPQKGQTRSNMAVGGTAEGTTLTPTDLKICETIGPELKRRGQVLVGIDVIGDKLTEVNVTSPTGCQEVKRLSGVDAATKFWDVVQDKLAIRTS